MLKIDSTQHMPEEAKGAGHLWEVLFKLNQLLLPFVVMWAVWATSNIFELKGQASVGERFTQRDGLTMQAEIREWVRANYPPDDLREELRLIRQLTKDNHVIIEEIKVLLAKNDILN